ncbi:MAG: TIGR01777 family protein [Ignavibacteriales bacterium]|nr:MAG: TIGR01777 family protein [Ignavibacteriales bacterium]
MKKRIIITGATGLIGQHLFKKLSEKEYEIIILSTDTTKAMQLFPEAHEHINWNSLLTDNFLKSLKNIYAVIHLAGASISGKRWSNKYKKIILNSRVNTTRKLLNAIKECNEKPEVFISSSAIGYYGSSLTGEFDESSEAGKGFLADVCKQWETEATKAVDLKMRYVCVRTGIVLANDGGALSKMTLPYKLFIGGPIGSGKQWMSWIHIEDLINIYIEALENPELSEAINATSPNPVKMNEFAKTIGKVLNRPAYFKVPSFVMKMLLGEASSIVLEGQKVLPLKIKTGNFHFRFPNLENAANDLLL